MTYDPDHPPQWRKHEVDDIARSAASMLVDLVRRSRDAIPSCLNCAYQQQGEVAPGDVRLWCSGHKRFPPPSIIVSACPQYKDERDIPF